MSRPPIPSLDIFYLRRLNVWLKDRLTGLQTSINKLLDGYGFETADGAPITSNYTVLRSDSFIPVDASSGAVTITLLGADELKKKRLTIKKVDSSTNAVTISHASDTIDDGANAKLNQQYESICIMSDGTEFWIV